VVVGNWDHSLKVTSLESGRLLQSVGTHKDVVTCVAMSFDNTLVRVLLALLGHTALTWTGVTGRL
jgi:hypothetical protein